MATESLDAFTNSVQPEATDDVAERSSNLLFDEIRDYSSEMSKLRWEGLFEDYLEKVAEQPSVARLAHRTAYEAVTRTEDFFTTGPNALFGAEQATEQFIKILKGGAEGLETSKRIILLMGPPGSGKSTLVKGTKQALEEYSKTDEGALYAIKDCPMHEEPLHLVPKELRGRFEEQLGVHIEGDLCPVCQFKYGGDKLDPEVLKQVPVERLFLSEEKRVGIGTFKPSDPKSQDMTELIGSPDFSGLAKYGASSNPNAYKFDGELNIASRGLMEFVEMLKSDERFLYVLLDLTQDKVIKAPRFANIYADEVILAHTNQTEYLRYVKDPKNEALRDRMMVVPVPYTLEVSKEKQIHEKLINQSEKVKNSSIHIGPHSLEVAAMFAVLTRLAPTERYSKMDKLMIYDHKDTRNLTQRDVKELRKKGQEQDEGMHGISPRYVIDSLSDKLADSDRTCLSPKEAIAALKTNLDYHPHTRDMGANERQAIEDDLAELSQVFDEMAKREIQKAFVYSYEDNARALCDNYLENIDAYCNGSMVTDEREDTEYEPNENLMRSIEEQIGVSENGKHEFRQEIVNRLVSFARKGQTFDYTTHPRLKEAIENKLFSDMKDTVKLTTTAKVPNEKQQKRIQSVEQTLIEEHGYCQHCAHELIEHVGSLFSRS